MNSASAAVTYTSADFSSAFQDAENGIVYDGNGFFAVKSASGTTVDLTINLNSLYNYAQGHDYLPSYMLQYKSNFANYGLADTRTQNSDGSTYTPSITGWTGSVWNDVTPISYSTLSQHADASNNVTFTITNSSSSGVSVSIGDTSVYTAPTLKYSSHTETQGYYINLNYVTGITLYTPSTLDVSTYELPPDYTLPFESERKDGTSVGRTMFLGDSITHGYGNQSHRWQLFKTLVDGGIENEIVGPRSGYHTVFSGLDDRDKHSTAYGGVKFDNVHLAQSSGRTHNIISGSVSYTVNGVSYGSGVNYGGHSTASAGESFDCNTFVCMMGTNDLLSDVDKNAAASAYTGQMQKMLGGTVSLDSSTNTWRWEANTNHLGTMGIIVSDVVNSDSDTFYVMSVPTWGVKNSKHGSDDTCRAAAEQYNGLLKQWVNHWNTDTSAATQGKVVYVEVNRGLVDVTAGKFIAPDAFMNATDGLHPTEQGALIIAGNLAQGMGIGGRTAGLERQGTSGWESATVGTVSAGAGAILVGGNAFTMDNGYTVDFSAVFGNGETGGWLSADNALSISLGDGTNSGTLNLSEGYIMWGDDILFCQDNSASGPDSLRVVWHNGNAADNVLKGYYVWLGDMLIGQGLSATEGQGLNGILFSASGADGSITNLTWTDTAYAPTTLGKYSAEHAYITTQDAAAVSGLVANTVLANMPAGGHDNAAAAVGSNVDYTGITGQTVAAGSHLVTTSPSSDSSFVITSTEGWIGLTNSNPTGAVNAQLTGTAVNAIFGVMNNGNAGDLTLEIAEGAVIEGTGKKYTPSTDVAIAGSYAEGGQHAKAASFNVYVNGGTVKGNIIGGAASGNGTINQVNLNINSGTVNGTVYGGSMGAPSTVGSANIRVSGGTITGDIVAGGLTGGTVGSAEVTISGGVIKGGITKGAAASSVVTIDGNKASIGGNIEADKVTLKNVSSSGYADGFDRYAGTISAPVVVLDNVKNNILATLEGLESLSAVNASMAEITAGDEMELQSLELGGGSSLGLFRSAVHTVSTETETTLTVIDSLRVSGSGSVLNANLVMAEGSMLNLAGNSLQLGSSLTLGGVALDNTTVNLVKSLTVDSSLTLFTGVDELIIGSDSWTGAMTTEASAAFSNAELDGYRLVYEGAASGKVSIATAAVPEPTTATLSLLALAALAARRRRK
ncbi:MAG: hypothetical protein IJE66_03460 [Akkermansia sp.]|nr:hypothetical protein [Akkermansia sp.]